MMTLESPRPVTVDHHYSPKFYAELWGVSESTVLRWFRDMPGVLKIGTPGDGRCELRIPWSLAQRKYAERAK